MHACFVEVFEVLVGFEVDAEFKVLVSAPIELHIKEGEELSMEDGDLFIFVLEGEWTGMD